MYLSGLVIALWAFMRFRVSSNKKTKDKDTSLFLQCIEVLTFICYACKAYEKIFWLSVS